MGRYVTVDVCGMKESSGNSQDWNHARARDRIDDTPKKAPLGISIGQVNAIERKLLGLLARYGDI